MRKTALLMTLFLTFVGTASAEQIGTVAVTMDAEGYTYAQLDINGEMVWFAAPAVELKVGDAVVAPAGMPMRGFHSKSLNRTFDVIYFVDAIAPAIGSTSRTTLPAGHPPINVEACPAPKNPSFGFSDIEKPEGAKTVAEIHAEAEALAGQPIVVCGIAVKVSNDIMDRNWIHIQDGTGEAPANDLTVTTTNMIEVGSIVTASGILATNLDFGYGYQYAVLLQDAAIE